MKTKYTIQLIIAAIILLSIDLRSQTPFVKQFDTPSEYSKKVRSEKSSGINLNSLKARFENHKKFKKYNPTFSVDVLDGKGIHLFTISNISSIPTIRVRVDINIGLTISL
ncbi:MAG: hypothetical protein A3F72_09055 [Bacteroidetes bacterium RIFCSPLOWO2_12_FULL_35_15]|nr:MAG: hypothetical protein A3F72_09055 [Bacteroidetes bacterium RIFCSPLOWO2_12_FULL_35_15]